jgi:ribosomal protein S18 acetylase RimI-like enzyme
MAVTMMRQDFSTRLSNYAEPSNPCAISELGRRHEPEVIEFLAARPLHTVFMSGLIRDNGMVSPRNRGSFYGSRNFSGQLEAVALVGHATLVEAHTENSLIGFARMARNCQNAHLIRGEQKSINTFWNHYSEANREPRLICSEQLFEMSEAPSGFEEVTGLRLTDMSDLERVLDVNASMAFAESGINPLQHDPNGFRNRAVRRIEQKRIWVWVKDSRLMFKADVIGETPDMVYLEGVYVHPEERHRGHGSRCLRKLASLLLAQKKSICLTANDRNKVAVSFYTKVGFEFRSHYETIYLRQESQV